MKSNRTYTLRYALFGAVAGLIFPVVATLVAIETTGLRFNWFTALAVQSTNPLLWIINTAPIFLGLVAGIAGLRQDALLRTNEELRRREIELQSAQAGLEQRVADQTKDLNRKAEKLERYAKQLEAITKIAQTFAAIQDLDRLLPSIAAAVSGQFDFYHIGIFLTDEKNQYVILHAASSEGGKKMLDRGHRLPVEATSIVGYAASRGEARIVLDVGAEAFYFNNPDLPETRSEMAVPLRVGGRVIGVLDVQSQVTNAFGQEDIEVLRILADQIAIAIENTRLFGETRRALSESQASYQRYIRQEWARFARRFEKSGYRYDGAKTMALTKKVEREDINAAIAKGEIIITTPSGDTPAALAVPVKSRGQVVGVIHVQATDRNRHWSQDEIVITQAAAERAAITMENIRLLHEAQRRAAKERTISAVSAKMSTSINLRNVLQVAVEELGRVLPGSEVALQLLKED